MSLSLYLFGYSEKFGRSSTPRRTVVPRSAPDIWNRLQMNGTRLTLRVDFGANRSIGPGKIRLLEAVGKTGSISQAGRALGMSYRRAWLLIDDLNRCFTKPVTTAKPGGAQGGGAALTAFGKALIRDFRAIEAAAAGAAKGRLRNLETSLRAATRAAERKTSIRGNLG